MNKVLTHLVILIILAACSSPASPAASVTERKPTATSKTPANLPNPASAYCEERGYKVEIRTAQDGSQSGVCIFTDGSECDEWAYFRGECYPGMAQNTPMAVATKTVLSLTPEAGTEFASDGCKIYRNTALGYSFHYPADSDIVEDDNPLHGISVIGLVKDGSAWPEFSIAHPGDLAEYLPPENVDLQQWLAEHYLLGEARLPDVPIAGTTAIHLRHDRSPQTYAYDRYFFAKSGQLYMVLIGHAGDREDWELYNHFLESFQFN